MAAGRFPNLRSPVLVGFLLLALLYGYVHQGSGWNQNSRLDLLHALVVKHSVRIDDYAPNTGDRALFNGHFFSEKAPGVTFVAFPAFVLSYEFLRARGIDLDSGQGWFISDWLTTALSVGLLTAFGGLVFVLILSRFIGTGDALRVTPFIFIGTGLFPYATMLFSHSLTAAWLTIALGATFHADESPSGRLWPVIVAGVCSGLAAASEVQAIIVGAGLALYTYARSRRHASVFVTSAFFPALLVPIYNVACFGGILNFGYLHDSYFPEMAKQIFGFGWPKLRSLWLLLGSSDKGLFFWSPFLLIAVGGYRRLWRLDRKRFALLLGVPATYVVLFSGFAFPDGGVCLGPRYLVPIIPFLGVACGLGWRELPVTGSLLGWLSVLLTGVATMITALPSGSRYFVTEVYLPALLRHDFAPNLGALLGWRSTASIVVPPLVAALGFQFLAWWSERPVRKTGPAEQFAVEH